MKQLCTILFLFIGSIAFCQIPSYYDDVNLNLTGLSLKSELSDKVTTTHTTNLSYTPGVWNALKDTDLDPTNSSNVILIYGYDDDDGITNTDRTRGVNENGGSSGDWNREHVYAKSLGTPNLGTSGPGADAHHLRSCDVSRNSQRGSRKFASGSGNSGTTGSNWYPGDEFKGDVARMMMYMYIRYGSRCLPNNVGIGVGVSNDNAMIDLFLDWNVDDPVSEYEDVRNVELEDLQGNRNPFIDNPAFATTIWGGPQAEDRFGSGGGSDCASSTYDESFESGFGSWAQSSSDNFNWSRRSGSTPSSNTGPSSASDGSYYIYMESSTPNYSSKRAIIDAPCFDLSNESSASVSFKYHMYGSSNMGNLKLERKSNSSWITVWSDAGNQGNSWQTATVDLSSYVGGDLELRFNGITGTTWQGDMAVDDFSLSSSGGGGSNEIAVNLEIIFDNYPEETSWEIEQSGQVIHSGGTYGSQADGSTINIATPLDPGCFSLIFYDTYGDGICCSYGIGSYELTDDDGSVLASGGQFGSQETKNFCVTANADEPEGETVSRSISAQTELRIFPNPADNMIIIVGVSEGQFTLVNSLGQVAMQGKIHEQISLKGVPEGRYILILETKEARHTRVLIVN